MVQGDAINTIFQTAHETNIISRKTPSSVSTSENDSVERTHPALPSVDSLCSATWRALIRTAVTCWNASRRCCGS